MDGRRKPYVAPVSLLVAGIFVFFLAPPLSGLSSSLDLQMNGQYYSALVRRLVAARLEAAGETLAEFAPRYDRRTESLSSLLLFLLVPLYSLPLMLLWRGRPWIEHLVFALGYVTCLVWGILFISYGLFVPLAYLVGDAPFALFEVTLLAFLFVHLYLAANRFYGGRRVVNALKALGFVMLVPTLQISYRLLLFLATLYSL